MKQLHNIQLGILQRLLFSESLRYTDMKPSNLIENNRFQFHLDQLIKKYKFIRKINGRYKLTSIGKEYANRIDDKNAKVEKQAKISAWVCCIQKRGKKKKYLIGTRLKQPFYGCQGFISGKVKYGESIADAAKRELKEESGLAAEKVDVCAIVHFRVFKTKTNKLLEDKFMYLCAVYDPKGQIRTNKEVKLEWVERASLPKYLTNPFESKRDFFKFISLLENFSGKPEFVEIDHFTNKF
ncbi:NUDIX domain-containing protein [Candidatus Woesebacteria bacterium]|nr:NUDIX domain-containing protein [Candidatus Woesebacteria bacterium]